MGTNIPSPFDRHSSARRRLTASNCVWSTASKLPAQAFVMRCLRSLAASASVRAYFSLRNGQSNRWTLQSMMSGPAAAAVGSAAGRGTGQRGGNRQGGRQHKRLDEAAAVDCLPIVTVSEHRCLRGWFSIP